MMDWIEEMEESKKVSIKYGGEKAKIFIKVKRYFGKVKNCF